MKKFILLTSLGFLLSACAPASGGPDAPRDTASDVGTAVKAGVVEAGGHAGNLLSAAKDDIYNTTDRFADWMRPAPKTSQTRPIPASYCYQALQDVLCYRQPMPGWEHRLVGYQGTEAKMPPPAMMKPLPVRASGTSMLPANRVATAKPLVIGKAEDNKAAEANPDEPKAITVDAAHESLPDPALAPQL